MAPCNNNAKQGTDTKKQMMTDTSALYNNNVNTDTTRAVTTEPVEPSLSTAVKESTMPKETSKPKEAKKSKITTVQPKQQQQANTSEPVAAAPVSNDADQTTQMHLTVMTRPQAPLTVKQQRQRRKLLSSPKKRV